MKSNKEDLAKRGYIEDIDITSYSYLSKSQLIALLDSKVAVERSMSLRILSRQKYILDYEMIRILLDKLKLEKSLYTKIEICYILEKGSLETAKLMVEYLGLIGNNQHSCLPDKVSKKISYTLPRDIIARSLGRMDISIVSVLLEVLHSNNLIKIREVIDAIGFLIFYNYADDMENIFNTLINCMNKNKSDHVIRWKIVLALSGFKSEDSINVLKKIYKNDEHHLIRKEAKRSIQIINNSYIR